MGNLKKMKKGITLIESLLALTLVSTATVGAVKGYESYNNYVYERALSKDITTLLRAVDTRISIDGYNYSFWTAGDKVEGLSQIAPYIRKTFISKNNAECGSSDGWVPQLDSEKDRDFVGCSFWQSRLPFDSDIKIETEENQGGFISSFAIQLSPELSDADEEGMNKRFKLMLNVLSALEKNDFANKNGTNSYQLVNKSNSRKMSNIACSQAGENCVIRATWEKRGFYQPLKTNGENAMISSNISFKIQKTDADSINSCLMWEEQSTNVWTSSPVECGIGMYSINGTSIPTTVHLNLNDKFTSNERIVLDKKCDIFVKDNGNGIRKEGTSFCGLANTVVSEDPVSKVKERKVIQYLDSQYIDKLTISETLFADDINNVNVIKVAMDLFNNLSGSSASLSDVKVDDKAIFDKSVTMLKSLNIGDSTTPLTDKMLTVSELNAFGSSFIVNENFETTNLTLDDEDLDSTTKTNIEVLSAFSDPETTPVLSSDSFVPNQGQKIGDSCPDLSSFTVDKDSGVVLTCKKDWKTSNLTWQSNYYGSIAAFQGSCPDGWNQMEDVHSRFLLGSGRYKEPFMAEMLYKARDKGGFGHVQLTESQLPEHDHATPKFDHICNACHFNQGLSHTRDGRSVFSNDSERVSSFVGKNVAHENRPNFLSVNYCIYGEGDGQSPGLTDPPNTGPDWVPYSPEQTGWLDDEDKKFYNCGASSRDYSPEEGIWYTKSECSLDQYQISYEREKDLNSGDIRLTGNETREYRTVTETQIWKSQEEEYSEWENVGEPYNCTSETKYYDSDTDDYYMKKMCDLNQEREVSLYEIELRFGDKRLIPEHLVNGGENPYKETQKIRIEVKRKVAGGGFDPGGIAPEDLTRLEGDYGETTIFKIKVKLNKPFEEDLVYRVNTQDITTTSILSKTENLVYDQFGNPFISVVDNQNGGRLMFDGGFPKYYNLYWNNADKFKDMPDQFKFMHNVIKWMSKTHESRGKVLLYGDRAAGNTHYHVKVTSSYGFRNSIPDVIEAAGFNSVVKDYQNYGGVYGSTKAHISLEEMNKYASIVVMSSGGWNSFTNETANNFTTYINNGGGVYIITDHDWFQPTGNQILQKFGSQFYGVVNRTPSHSAYKLSTIWANLSGTEYDSNHDLWEGLKSNDSIHAGGSEGNVRLFTPVQDLVGMTQDLIFLAGETEKEISVTINGDDLAEQDETFKIVLSNPESGVIVGNSEIIVTIIDDDSGVKSLSMSCGAGIPDMAGTCINTKLNKLSTKETLSLNESNITKGTIKVRHDEYGEILLKVRIGDYSFEGKCENQDFIKQINEDSLIVKDFKDRRVETQISDIKILSETNWKSSSTLKSTYITKDNNCYGLIEDFDYNINVEAMITNKLFNKESHCPEGVFKDGYCEITERYKAEESCKGDYEETAGYCFKK